MRGGGGVWVWVWVGDVSLLSLLLVVVIGACGPHGLMFAMLELSDCVRLMDLGGLSPGGVSVGAGEPYQVFRTCLKRRGSSKGLLLRLRSVVVPSLSVVRGR